MIPNTTFAQASVLSEDWKDDVADGLLGLAFSSLAVDGVVPPFINAIDQGLVAEPLFTVFLSAAHGGMFTWGGVDEVNCGPLIAYVNLTSSSFYEFTIQGVQMGDKYKRHK